MCLQKDQQLSSCGRNICTWLYEPSLWHWTWRQQTSLLAYYSGPWWCITIPSLVIKGSVVEEILPRWTFTGIFNLFCDLDLDYKKAINFFHKAIQLMMICHQTKFSCKRISSSEDILESQILIIWSFTVTLALKTANQSLWKTVWLIMMHHHTKLGSERFRNSEDFTWTNTD